MQEARRRARAAAEKRAALPSSSGQRLGGTGPHRHQNIRKVIADAASRRITVMKGCGIESNRKEDIIEEASRNGFRTKAEEDDANEAAIMQAYIELLQEEERERYGEDYIQPSSKNPAGSQGQQHSGSSREASDSYDRPEVLPVPTMTKPKENSNFVDLDNLEDSDSSQGLFDSWTCEICTLHNPSTYLCCDACGTERSGDKPRTKQAQPIGASKSASTRLQPTKSLSKLASLYEEQQKKPVGWLCHSCGNYMENEWWTCSQCGTMKLSS